MEEKTIGVLYKLTPGWPLNQQIKAAKRNFENAPHAGLIGHLPVHARLHPSNVPANVLESEGLLLLADDTVRPGYVRITTASFSAEFAAERGYIARRLLLETVS